MNVQDEIKALKQRITESEELLSKLEQQIKQEQPFPQVGDTYWYVSIFGVVLDDFWDDHITEKDMLKLGNVYKTEQQAEFAVEKLKVEAELRKFSRPFTWREKNWFLTMDSDKDILSEYDDYGAYQGTIYFESKEKAIEAIESVGEYRIKKYIFGVED